MVLDDTAIRVFCWFVRYGYIYFYHRMAIQLIKQKRNKYFCLNFNTQFNSFFFGHTFIKNQLVIFLIKPMCLHKPVIYIFFFAWVTKKKYIYFSYPKGVGVAQSHKILCHDILCTLSQ